MKAIIRFTTKQGFTARPDIRVAGSLEFCRKVAKDALAIHHADAYTYSIQIGKSVRHFSADYHHEI